MTETPLYVFVSTAALIGASYSLDRHGTGTAQIVRNAHVSMASMLSISPRSKVIAIVPIMVDRSIRRPRHLGRGCAYGGQRQINRRGIVDLAFRRMGKSRM